MVSGIQKPTNQHNKQTNKQTKHTHMNTNMHSIHYGKPQDDIDIL